MQKCTGISNCRAYASDWPGDFIPRGKIVFTKLLACFLVWSKHPGTMTRLSITEQPPRRPVLSTFGTKSWLNERLPVEIYPGRRRKPWHLFGFGWIANECNPSQVVRILVPGLEAPFFPRKGKWVIVPSMSCGYIVRVHCSIIDYTAVSSTGSTI
jgi:hypothetical protein